MNVGEVRNKGWELSLSWNDRINDFGYSISGNLSDNRNEVIDLGVQGRGKVPIHTRMSDYRLIRSMDMNQWDCSSLTKR